MTKYYVPGAQLLYVQARPCTPGACSQPQSVAGAPQLAAEWEARSVGAGAQRRRHHSGASPLAERARFFAHPGPASPARARRLDSAALRSRETRRASATARSRALTTSHRLCRRATSPCANGGLSAAAMQRATNAAHPSAVSRRHTPSSVRTGREVNSGSTAGTVPKLPSAGARRGCTSTRFQVAGSHLHRAVILVARGTWRTRASTALGW